MRCRCWTRIIYTKIQTTYYGNIHKTLSERHNGEAGRVQKRLVECVSFFPCTLDVYLRPLHITRHVF